MRIRINSSTTFVITEQSEQYLETYYFDSPIVGNIEVAKSCYPEVRYLGYKTMVFVRGRHKDRDNLPLEVNCPNHLPHILKALEDFCTFNDEPFEIESCIL